LRSLNRLSTIPQTISRRFAATIHYPTTILPPGRRFAATIHYPTNYPRRFAATIHYPTNYPAASRQLSTIHYTASGANAPPWGEAGREEAGREEEEAEAGGGEEEPRAGPDPKSPQRAGRSRGSSKWRQLSGGRRQRGRQCSSRWTAAAGAAEVWERGTASGACRSSGMGGGG
jgi:hypothetical protein